MENSQHDPFKQDYDRIGPEIEWTEKRTEAQHRLRKQSWMRMHIYPQGFREDNKTTSSVYAFSYICSIELQNMRHALACLACIEGRCKNPHHSDRN